VSGKRVDKSTAVIGAAPDGKVYYFENAEDLKAFAKTQGQ
jgi:YHS domain-containing protein